MFNEVLNTNVHEQIIVGTESQKPRKSIWSGSVNMHVWHV